MVQNAGFETDDSSPENLAAHRDTILDMDDLVMYEDSESMIREFVTRARPDY